MPRKDYQPDHDNLGGSNRALSMKEAATHLGVPYSTMRNRRGRTHRKRGSAVTEAGDFKALVRRRMAATGEKYTVA